MKDLFPGHYQPTQADFDRLWKDGVLVLDTNVLLNLYRHNPNDREALITVLEKEQGRIWIPHHVALEYQQSRLSVIDARLSSYDAILNSVRDAVARINKDHAERRIKNVDVQSFITELEANTARLEERIKTAQEKESTTLLDDALRGRIENIFTGRIGEAPTQKWLDDLFKEGVARGAAEVPPGFIDMKEKQGEWHAWNGLRFHQAYGDLIVWRQIQEKAAQASWSDIILITDDRKEDWWAKKRGQHYGPRPELVSELKTSTKVERFWMYTSWRFLEYANARLGSKVPEDTIRNVKELAGPLVTEAFETISDTWEPHDFHVDQPVDSLTEFHASIHTSRTDQIFAVYYQVSSPIGLFWLGFTNREGDVFHTANEHTIFFGQSNQLNYSLVDLISSTVFARFHQLKGHELRVIRIRCRGDAASKDKAKFFVSLRRR